MSKIFVIDDEADVLTSIKMWGEKQGYNVTTFQNSEGFLDKVMEVRPEVILIDINLRDDDGRLISEDLKNILPYHVKIILISGDPVALLEYQHHQADGILNKPFTFSDLDKKLKQHLRKK